MKPTFNDKLIAYLVLFSGLAISGVAEYYSIMGLMAIYPAAIIPIVIMGVVLGIGKISGTVWLKQNWEWAPMFLKVYVLPAIVVLMLITSLGVFGFLSKAHSDQSLVSGDVTSKIAVYDEKIKTAKENIDANRKALKQMDEAVDQSMARSADEKGADKAVAIRRGQQKERQRLQSDITAEQKTIAQLSEERAPIAAEVRKVEAEVGPIKYIAHLLYGENPDANILEKAVIWVTVLIVIVLDPLAVVLLLASQYSFQRFREVEEEDNLPVFAAEVGEPPTEEERVEWKGFELQRAYEEEEILDEPVIADSTATVSTADISVDAWNAMIEQAEQAVEADKQSKIEYQILEDVEEPVPEPTMLEKHPYLSKPFVHFSNMKPMPSQVAEYEEPPIEPAPMPIPTAEVVDRPGDYVEQPTFDFNALPEGTEYVVIDGHNMHLRAAKDIYKQTPKETVQGFTEVIEPEITFGSYVQNEEQNESSKWNRVISEAEYREQAKAKLENDTKNNPNNAA